jgi:cytochrome c551
MLLLLLACSHTPDADAGAEVYDRTCSSCHGADGADGVQVNGVPAAILADVVPGMSDDELTSVIQDGSGEMPAQGLDDDETADCIAWLRQTFP